jgi:hypothetical protein
LEQENALEKLTRSAMGLGAIAGIFFAGVAQAQTARCPNMLIHLDRSGSMEQAAGGGNETRWEAARKALLGDGVALSPGLVNKYGHTIGFGLNLWPADPVGSTSDGCGVYGPQVKPHVNSRPHIVKCLTGMCLDQYNVSEPNGNTPLASSLHWLMHGYKPPGATQPGPYTPIFETDRKQFLLLITDGEPTCSGGPVPENASSAAQQVKALKQRGVGTFVIGFGNNVGKGTLNMLAMAGGHPRVAPTPSCTNDPGGAGCPELYHRVNDRGGLETVFDQIVRVIVDVEMGGQGCDDSCFGQGCPGGQMCDVKPGDDFPACVPNPCANRNCGTGEYCRLEGTIARCVGACTSACPGGQLCDDGICVDDPCAGVSCPSGKICSQGSCVANACGNCKAYERCVNGRCALDPCSRVTCPSGTYCGWNAASQDAQCQVDLGGGGGGPGPGGGGGGEKPEGSSKGGCASGGAEMLAPGVLAFLLGLRRRRL